MKIRWFGHASFCIETEGKTIYIDPYILPKKQVKADIILVTHEHYDHCEIKNIRRLRKPHTAVIASSEAAKKIGDSAIARAGDLINIRGVYITAVNAYNIDKYFHKKGDGLGFVIESDGKRIYHSGDTDLIPEMNDLENIDVALMSVGGKYTMDYLEAAEAVKTIKPRIAIPMHWGSVVGEKQDAEGFKKKVEEETETRVYIMENAWLSI
ncbi:MAG: metal-dependent hydrolase [Candidatus Altiarchaeota archaeon]|nr:metal-dependent hydrolase [Candidatus Altiarchaeota archaeon]